MRVTEWVQSHRRSILFLFSSLGIAGLVSGLSLPVGLFPQHFALETGCGPTNDHAEVGATGARGDGAIAGLGPGDLCRGSGNGWG